MLKERIPRETKALMIEDCLQDIQEVLFFANVQDKMTRSMHGVLEKAVFVLFSGPFT